VQDVLDSTHPFIEAGVELVGVEPSEVLTFRDEFLDLCEESQLPTARNLAERSFLLEEWVLRMLDSKDSMGAPDSTDSTSHQDSTLPIGVKLNGNGALAVHGHCHAKALGVASTQIKALQKVGYAPEQIPAGCCGMAGSFGYELKSSDVSKEIANLRLLPWIAEKNPERIVAHGFSCRHQIEDLAHLPVSHPAILLDEAIQPAE
jgi:Fe-S oxidoreductase